MEERRKPAEIYDRRKFSVEENIKKLKRKEKNVESEIAKT